MRPTGRLSLFGKRLSALLISAVVALLLCGGLALAFTDVKPGDDYAEPIDELSILGVISGFDDDTFRPNEPVTRQQFAKMIVKTLGLTVTGTEVCPFVDVAKGMDPSDPFYPDKYVAVCAANGITQGKTPTTFAPYANITRAQVMTMVVRAALNSGIALDQPTSTYYNDSKYIMRTFNDPDHGLNAQMAELNGLLWGIRLDRAGAWDPWRNATRGEVALMLWRLKQKMAPPTPGTNPTEPPQSDLLVSDDFSDPNSGWDTSSNNNVTRSYTDLNDFMMRLTKPSDSGYIAASPYTGTVFGDAYCEAWAWPGAASGDWGFGLVFRYQDIRNFYLLVVNSDDSARLWKRAEGEWTQMSSRVILPPVDSSGWRHLEVSMLGDSFGAWVDDVDIGYFTDDSFAQGRLGFYVETFGAPQCTAYFDDFKVWRIIY